MLVAIVWVLFLYSVIFSIKYYFCLKESIHIYSTATPHDAFSLSQVASSQRFESVYGNQDLFIIRHLGNSKIATNFHATQLSHHSHWLWIWWASIQIQFKDSHRMHRLQLACNTIFIKTNFHRFILR